MNVSDESLKSLAVLPLYHPSILTLGSILVLSETMREVLNRYDYLSTYDIIFDSVNWLKWKDVREFYSYLKMFTHLNRVFVHSADFQNALVEADAANLQCHSLYLDGISDALLPTYHKYCTQVSTLGALGDQIMMSDIKTVSFFLKRVPSRYLLSYQNMDHIITRLKTYMDSLDKENVGPILEVFIELTRGKNGKKILHKIYERIEDWNIEEKLRNGLIDANNTNLFLFDDTMKSLSPVDFLKLTIGLTYCSQMKSFDCSRCDITQGQINGLFQSLSQFESLKYMYLTRVPLVPEGKKGKIGEANIEQLCDQLRHVSKTLISLDLGKTGMNQFYLNMIIDALTADGPNTQLITIYLEDNNIETVIDDNKDKKKISKDTVDVLTKLFTNLTALKHVYLDSNSITDATMKSLEKVIADSDHLENIYVTHNGLSDILISQYQEDDTSRINA